MFTKKRLIFSIVLFIFVNFLWVYFFKPYVQIDLSSSTTNNQVLIFYNNGLKEGYPFDDQHMAEPQILNGSRATLRFEVPASGLNKLRLDLGNSPTSFEINSIVVYKSFFQKTVLDQKEFLENFNSLNDISEYQIVEDRIVIKTSGEDAHLYSEEALKNQHFDWRLSSILKESILFFVIAFFFVFGKIKKPFINFIRKIQFKMNYRKRKSHKGSKFNGVLSFLLVPLLAFLISLFFDRIVLNGIRLLAEKAGLQTIHQFLLETVGFSWERIYFFFIFLFILLLVSFIGLKSSIRFRYLLALLFFTLMVIGKFTGSSLGFYDNMLHSNTSNYQKSTILGIPQGLRGDEWATEKPYYFAQVMTNDDNKLAYFNNNLNVSGSDMVVSAFAPVKDIVVVARPDLWGFLILPPDHAFSFYWWSRLILLFMSSFEMGVFLTKRYKYGLVAALVICFAPPVQWWLSQTLMLMIMSGQFALIFLNNYFKEPNRFKKYLWILGVGWSGLIYILTMYPATQVPLGYIFLSLLIYILITNKEDKPFSLTNLGTYLVTAIPFGLILVHFYLQSHEALSAITNTVYPGKVRPWIMLPWDYYLNQFVNVTTAIVQHPGYLNSSEISQFYTFMPFVILATVLFVRKNKSQRLLPCLLLSFTMMLWIVSWFPEFRLFNKFTLFSFTYPIRITYASGYGFTLLIIYLLPHLKRNVGTYSKVQASLVAFLTGFFTLCVLTNSPNVFGYFKSFRLGTIVIILIVILMSYMGYLLLRGGREQIKTFTVLLVLLSIGSTVMVNPVTQGTDSMFEKTAMKKIREINATDKGRWMVSGSPTISNLVTAQGVARTSGTYYYPDWTMMSMIDETHEFVNMWNQFAHVDMRLTDGKLKVETFDHERSQKVNGTNRIFYIPLETAKKIDVKYIFTMFPLPELILKKKQVQLLYQDPIDEWAIYKVNEE